MIKTLSREESLYVLYTDYQQQVRELEAENKRLREALELARSDIAWEIRTNLQLSETAKKRRIEDIDAALDTQ